MQNIIVGTAGHIDHGKTALVRALTGIDTDRLEEEKRRGISIELGFAHLDLGGGLRAGFVDVPGHERFVKNMLAGVGGIDVVLLVIAADESVKPQTREHFDICRLLGIPHGIIVLTKTDLVEPDILELVRLEVDEFVAGSFLEGAPVVPVSSKTGAGLDDLKQHLRVLAGRLAQRDSSVPFRLPIDRAFTMKGFGAVVTGTLIAGSLSVEQEVEAQPAGLRARVRGLQVHGEPVSRAVAGQRTAVNLAGVDAAQLVRGMTLAEAGRYKPARIADCRFQLLSSARPMKHRSPIHLHAGTAEVIAEVRLLERKESIRPGEEAFVRLLLREPLLMLPGDRFIARLFSPLVTIGGGVVLDIDPPKRGTQERLAVLLGGDTASKIALLIRESVYGMALAGLSARTGLSESVLREAASGATVLEVSHPWFIDTQWFTGARERLRAALVKFHKANPLLAGMTKEQLRGEVLPGSPPFLLDALLFAEPALTVESETVRLTSHTLTLREDEQQALNRIEERFRASALNVPPLIEVLAKSGVDAARARTLLQMLFRQKRLVKVSEELVFHDSAIKALRLALSARKGQRFQVGEFKEWTGVSRKYAIPLLEFLDREKVTRRDGDSRIVL